MFRILLRSFILCCIIWGVKGSLGSRFVNSYVGAWRQTLQEQRVDDINTVLRCHKTPHRRLIVLPLTSAFVPSKYNSMTGKEQYGDKCSLPKSLGSELFDKYDMPWIFEVSKVGNSSYSGDDAMPTPPKRSILSPHWVNKAYIGPLDFRSPENYIYLPKWLMSTLRIQKYDLVDIRFVKLKMVSSVVLQPLSTDWDTFLSSAKDNINNILENEINKYSSLTTGSTILINIGGVEYPLRVKQTIAEDGVPVNGVRIQDSNVKVDIDRSILDKIYSLKSKYSKKQQ